MKKIGIFEKVFLYTLSFLVVTIAVTGVLFAGQFKSFYDNNQQKMLANIFQPLLEAFENKSDEEIRRMSEAFQEKNQSFEFTIGRVNKEIGETIESIRLKITDENIIYKSPSSNKAPESAHRQTVLFFNSPNIFVQASSAANDVSYLPLYSRIAAGLALLLFVSVIGAAFFAKGIVTPIKKLAANTKKMAALLPVPPASGRRDEIGRLEEDVHDMYEKLKSAIDNQRYFFSAASHELKTPIAATTALLEGMAANIGEYANHPKYLRECLKMMNTQNRIISEILEIVNLSDGVIKPDMEKINLSELVDSILLEYIALTENNGQKLTVNVPPDAVCLADKNMLGRSISNIIMNAVQNTGKNGEIKIWSRNNGDAVRLSVMNLNAHIDENILNKLFEPFYREDSVRSRAAGRSGLGLAIVKKMLDSMGIPFSLENRDNDVVFLMDIPKT